MRSTAKKPRAIKEIDTEFFQHRGKGYGGVLKLINNVLFPKRFFEVGTRGGQSLRQFDADAVCVDPRFFITTDPILKRTRTFFFQMSSDAFFEKYSPSHLLDGPIDVAFLDGFHRFEYLLRDFINTEKHCRQNSLIIMHDCLPPHPFMTRRSPDDGKRILARLDGGAPALSAVPASPPPQEAEPAGEAGETPDIPEIPAGVPGDAPVVKMGWSGDVYRMMFILKQFRPDLRVHYFDTPPTGLVIATNLNPKSTVLSDSYFEAVEMAGAIKLDFEKLHELFTLYPMFKTKETDADLYSMNYTAFS